MTTTERRPPLIGTDELATVLEEAGLTMVTSADEEVRGRTMAATLRHVLERHGYAIARRELLVLDLHDLEADDVLADDMHLRVVDAAAHGRKIYGDGWPKLFRPGTVLADHDWRFELVYERTGKVSFHADADAAHVAAYVEAMLRERVQ